VCFRHTFPVYTLYTSRLDISILHNTDSTFSGVNPGVACAGAVNQGAINETVIMGDAAAGTWRVLYGGRRVWPLYAVTVTFYATFISISAAAVAANHAEERSKDCRYLPGVFNAEVQQFPIYAY
jgi:hypothetical protein